MVYSLIGFKICLPPKFLTKVKKMVKNGVFWWQKNSKGELCPKKNPGFLWPSGPTLINF